MILVFMFRSLLAAGLPVITAVFAVGSTLGVIILVSHFVDIASYTAPLMMLVGLGVGVDYALLIFSRYRTELLAGLDRETAALRALDTAGRSVLFAGSTVMIALLGLLALGLGSLRGVALAVALTVLVTMLASITLLPALLSLFGARIERGIRRHAAKATRERGNGWRRLADRVQRRPLVPLVCGVVALAALSLPALGMRLGFAGSGTDPTSSTSRQAYDLVTRLRTQVLPSLPGKHLVGGSVAAADDYADAVAGRLPLFILVVVGLSALLLMFVFRSILIPLKAAVLNLLSIGASLGVITLVFGYGLFGAQAGPIEAYVPVMIFAIVFGLSMDYEVFLVSRMHEEWRRDSDARAAVREGLAATGGVITAAAAIMVAVFGAFLLDPSRMLQQFGLGLAFVRVPGLVVPGHLDKNPISRQSPVTPCSLAASHQITGLVSTRHSGRGPRRGEGPW
jgi:RND superfamily putative drug exporter